MFSSLSRGRRIALIILTALALVVTIMSLGMVIPPTLPFGSVKLYGPICADSDGNRTVIADTEAHRVLVLDKDLHLMSVISFDEANSPLDAVTDLCITKDSLYISGIRYLEESTEINYESVFLYDFSGARGAEVYKRDADGATVPSIKSLGDAYGSAIITVVEEAKDDDSRDVARAYLIDDTGCMEYGEGELDGLEVFDAGFEPDNGYFVTISPRGMIDDTMDVDSERLVEGDYVFTSVDVNADGRVFVTEDASGKVYIIDEDSVPEVYVEAAGQAYTDVNVNGDTLCACSREGDIVLVMDNSTGDTTYLRRVELSLGYSLFLVLIWACRLFLIGEVVAVCIARARMAVATGETDGMGGLFAAFCVLLSIALAIGYASLESYNASLKTREAEISMLSEILYFKADDLTECMEACTDRHALQAQGDEFKNVAVALNELCRQVDHYSLAAESNDIGIYYRIFSKDDYGIFLLNDSAQEFVMGASMRSSAESAAIEHEFALNDEFKLREGRTLRDNTRYCLIPISSEDGERVIGVIEMGSRIRSFESQLFNSLANNVVTAFVMLFVVYIVYSELRACGRCLLEYLKFVEDHDKKDAVALLTRPFTFLITMLISTDALMSTLIGRSLLTDANLDAQGVLVIMPAMMQGVGLVCGQVAYGSLGWRVGVRRLICTFAILLMIGAVLAGFSVAKGDFWAYIAAKVILGIPFGLLYTLGYSLPRQAIDDDVRTLASGGVRRTDTSAAAMGTVLGGFVANRFGNAWVYVLVALGGALVIAFATRLVLRHQKPLESERGLEVTGAQALLSFFRQRDTLALIVLIMLPATLAGGYNSLLFPLYSADLGLSSATISYMFVLGQLVVYVLIDTLDNWDARYGKWMVAVGAVALLAAVFLLFSLNTRFTWAVVAIALVGVFCKASDDWKALWARQADVCGVPLGRATGAMFATRSVLLVVQPLILGVFLSVSESIAAILLGIICLVCVTGFVFLTHNSKMRI